MYAYYQNQVVSKDKISGKHYTFVQEGNYLGFLESQYALNITMTNVVRELSAKTNKDNPAKVYCVCDYDVQTDNSEYTKEWLFPASQNTPEGIDGRAMRVGRNEKGEIVKEMLEPSRFLKPAVSFDHVDDIELQGLFSGFVICKDTKEYLDIENIEAIANQVFDEHQMVVISPIALLTRKNKHSMGDRDIHKTTYAKKLEKYITKWYDKDIYWSSERPSDDFADITITTLAVEKMIKEKTQGRFIFNWYLVPAFGAKHLYQMILYK